MPEGLSKFAAWILGPSVKAEDDDFETGFDAADDEEPTDIVEMQPARAARERPQPVSGQASVTSLDQRRRALPVPGLASAEIKRVSPRAFSEAAGIGESFKEGKPVILNLTTTDEKPAQKLIDFASGMAFATGGRLERITPTVFLLMPASYRLTDIEKSQLAESPIDPA